LSRDLRLVLVSCLGLGKGILRFLLDSGFRVQHLVSLSAEQARRHQIANYASYEELSAELGIPLYVAESYALTSDRDLQFFREQEFDVLVMGGWQRLFPAGVLETLRVGGIGIHGSSEFLPLGRGRSPVNWSLIEGKRRFIQQLFLMRPGVDDGDIIAHDSFDINEWDDCATLHHKSTIVSKRLIVDVLKRLKAGQTLERWQQAGEPSFYPKRTPDDGAIDWTKTVFEIHNHIRAQTRPFPGAFSYLGGNRVYFWRAQPFDTRITYFGRQYGEVVEILDSGEFVVNCRSGLLLARECSAAVRVGDVFRTRPDAGREPV
jgi:methionyl-tRNA formyltransferase